MKKLFFAMLVLTLAAALLSCEALPINHSSGQSWFIDENAANDKRVNLEILFLKVEKSGGWDFVEKEAAFLAPLYFWNEGCKVTAKEKASYTAGIQLREREYNLGWQTKRSLVIEVRIWVREDAENYANEDEALFYEKKLPIAAGRIVATGEKSFSSSDTTGKLLSKAVKNAVKELFAHE